MEPEVATQQQARAQLGEKPLAALRYYSAMSPRH